MFTFRWLWNSERNQRSSIRARYTPRSSQLFGSGHVQSGSLDRRQRQVPVPSVQVHSVFDGASSVRGRVAGQGWPLDVHRFTLPQVRVSTNQWRLPVAIKTRPFHYRSGSFQCKSSATALDYEVWTLLCLACKRPTYIFLLLVHYNQSLCNYKTEMRDVN